jgi:hypothetical protein
MPVGMSVSPQIKMMLYSQKPLDFIWTASKTHQNYLSQSKNEAMVYVVDQHANLMIWQASLILGNQQLVGCE